MQPALRLHVGNQFLQISFSYRYGVPRVGDHQGCSIKAGTGTQGTEGLGKHMASPQRLKNPVCMPETSIG